MTPQPCSSVGLDRFRDMLGLCIQNIILYVLKNIDSIAIRDIDMLVCLFIKYKFTALKLKTRHNIEYQILAISDVIDYNEKSKHINQFNNSIKHFVEIA